jgi:hypothetical protein
MFVRAGALQERLVAAAPGDRELSVVLRESPAELKAVTCGAEVP